MRFLSSSIRSRIHLSCLSVSYKSGFILEPVSAVSAAPVDEERGAGHLCWAAGLAFKQAHRVL